MTTEQRRAAGPVFVSYATSDRKQALALCKALERRGTKCWISCRDVEPGENYQEAIVRAIRGAPAMVLVFSDAANNSDEIKKELSLVSRHRIPVMAVRIEDVEPSDAFAYELSTRQWIDAFEGWDKSIDSLNRRLEQISCGSQGPAGGDSVPPRPARTAAHRKAPMVVAAVLALVVAAGLAAWLLLRPADAAAHSMQVRLTGFERLSPELPETIGQALSEEFLAAFSDEGVISVSTATQAPGGTDPAYALGGTIRRDGDRIRVIARLTNERSGTTLWSHNFTYAADQLSRVPRRVAVAAGNLVRCGLFGATTYPRALPDPILINYFQYCHNVGEVEFEPTKALDFADKTVAAAPDFSWGWSAVAKAAMNTTQIKQSPAQMAAVRAQGRQASDKAIGLDPTNSEALAFKSYLIDARDLVGREALLRQSLDARPLPCGCEHHFYGNLLEEVGRTAEAIIEFRRSTDVLALKSGSQLSLGEALLIVGRPDEAKKHLDAAADLAGRPNYADEKVVATAPITGQYAAAAAILKKQSDVPAPLGSALVAAFHALVANDQVAKAAAAARLVSLPEEFQGRLPVTLLGALGANREALAGIEAAERAGRSGVRKWLFYPSMAGARAEPEFAAVAERLGLIHYWRKTGKRPDFCSAANAPPLCRTI
ncbi:TIR domain-containing protein [Sphingomonas sp.]|uniref:TIR domain-containing protein n=1 Tax=Sphingomonas sp. TaxID=28214 RepID=UPI0017962ED2|nr:TIR domain-containing protein [Sphingomonas sp.]MBA3511285.1 TIR domain-containing protein [Sphingomonas sp.]